MTVDKSLLPIKNNFIINIIISLIQFIDSFRKNNEKLIDSHLLNGIQIKSDEGWSYASYIHMTKPFEIYKLYLENGMQLDCADEHIVFTKNFIEKWVKDLTINDYVITENGLSKVLYIERTRIFVNMCDISVLNEKESYYTNGILSHNTTTSAIFLLHYILFNVDKNSLVLGNKRKTANEILDKIKKIFLEIPYFLKPGIYKWNEGEIVIDNGCRCMSEATTINSGISFTFHCILADEFAHIPPNIMESFYNNIFPTVTAAKARFMITSTQNGYNLFYRLYNAAVRGENEYHAFKTDWWEVPEWNPDLKCWEQRDEKWHALQVANYGSEEAFNRQFGTNFEVSSNTLISRKVLTKKLTKAVEFVNKEIPGVTNIDSFYWDPEYNIENLRKDFFIITVDLAEGIGNDYTTYVFNKIEKNGDNVKTKCIGYYSNNYSNIEINTTSLIELCNKYMNINNYLISYESNLYGELFKKIIFYHVEKYNPQNFDESVLVKYYNDRLTQFTFGVKMTTYSKHKACNFFKNAYESDEIDNCSTLFLNEIQLFCDNKGNGTYQASFGHDDMVMAQMQLVLVQETLQYKQLLDVIDNGVYIEEDNGFDFYGNMSIYNDYDLNKQRFLNGC